MESQGRTLDIDELINKLKAKALETKEIYDALNSIRKLSGNSFELPDINSLLGVNSKAESVNNTNGNMQIKPDQFFQISQTRAAAAYLKMVGHAMHLDDIYNALKEGGVAFGSDGKKVLYTQVGRASKTFVRINGDGLNSTFGLVKMYPARKADEKATNTRPRVKISKEESLTQPEGQVQAVPEASKNDDDTQGTTTENPDQE